MLTITLLAAALPGPQHAAAQPSFSSDLSAPAKLPAAAPAETPDPKTSAFQPPQAGAPASSPLERAACGPDGRPDLSRPHFALAADGWWALGADFKARFGADGFDFTPHLGARAPRNFPLALDLALAKCSGAPLRFDALAAPELRGDSVRYVRGAFEERYDVSARGVEQSFVFTQLPRRGELRIEFAFESELVARAHGAGVRFEGEHGGVDVSGVKLFDARGASLELPLQLDGQRLALVAPAEFVAAAQLPLTIDPVFSTFAIDATNLDMLAPDVAYDANAGVWRSVAQRAFSAADSDVWTVALDAQGVAIAGSSNWVDITAERWSHARIAHNALAARFLVVAETGALGSRRIKGRLATSTNNQLGAVQTLDGGEAGDKLRPDVGGDPEFSGPTYFCVVWQRDLTPTDSDVHARLVSGAGTPFGASLMIDNSGPTLDAFPSITDSNGKLPFSTQQWMIVWQRDLGGNADIRAARVRWDGQLTQPSFVTQSTPQAEFLPVVAGPLDDLGAGRRYMIAYQVFTSANNSDIEVRTLEGTQVVSQMNLSIVQPTGDANQFAPSICTDGYQFSVAYCDDWLAPGAPDICVDHVAVGTLSNQTTLLISREVLSSAFELETAPRIASAHAGGGVGSRSLAVWDILRGSHRDVLGAFVGAASGLPLEAFCFGTAQDCPCGNVGNPNRGCANSYNLFGAALSQHSGSASLAQDDLRLLISGVKPGVSCLVFASASHSLGGTPFGDGRRCVLSPTQRGRLLQANGGVALYPQTGDAPLSELGAAHLGGDVRYYQAWYRDSAALCGAGNFNLTNAQKVIWIP
jgi:hypothetical protein